MTVQTLLQYLVGQRQAILSIAGCRQTVWLGILFVVSAGFAREYDGEDLLREPWHLLIPLGASLATSFLLFALIWLIATAVPANRPSFFKGYRSFLGLYWMTAPLAWLYAVPVERFLSAADATVANLWLLGIVAVWRVALMIRVGSVIYGATVGSAVAVVMLFADTVLLAVLYFTPLPIFSIMGGIRLTESERVIQSVAFSLGALGLLSWPIWLIGTVGTAVGPWNRWKIPAAADLPDTTVTRSLWIVGLLSVFVWFPVLPITQPEQQLRRAVELQLHEGRLRDALELMSEHERHEFPPHWDPPPRVGYGQRKPSVLDLVETANSIELRPWVRSLVVEKLRNHMGSRIGTWNFWGRLDAEELDRYLTILEQTPERAIILDAHREALSGALGEHSERSESQKVRIRRLLGIEPVDVADPAVEEE